MRWMILAAALASGDAPPNAAQAESQDAQFDRYRAAVVEAARHSNSARVLIAAASFAAESALRPVEPGLARRRDALGERALRLGADDPVVWYVLAVDCPLSKAACERANAVARLRQVAPNNALGWLLEAPGDDADAVFARAVAANRHDTYDGEFVRALYDAASAVPAPAFFVDEVRAAGVAAPERVAHATLGLGVWMAKGWGPQAGAIGARCGAGQGRQGREREACIALGRLLLNRSRGVLAQRIGSLLLAARLPDGQERDDVFAARRRLEWMQEQALEVLARDPFPASTLNWLHAGADEIGVLRATLSENGIPAEPPSGWRSRSSSVLPALAPAAD